MAVKRTPEPEASPLSDNLSDLSLLLRLATPGPLPPVLEKVREMMEVDTERGQEAIACLIVLRLNPAFDFTKEQEAAMRGMDRKTLRTTTKQLPPLR